MKNNKLPRPLILCASLLMAYPTLSHATAGHFQFISGEVQVLNSAGQSRVAIKGGDIDQGDTVVTTKAASAQLRMQDGGILAVRPDSKLRIDTFNYNGKEDGSEKGLFSLLKGEFRSITGAVGHTNKENLKIKTPSATIGIRGTDGEIGVNPDTGLTGVHTFVGGHTVTAPDANGNLVTLFTNPGQIVLVTPGSAPTYSNTFPFSSGSSSSSSSEGSGTSSGSTTGGGSTNSKITDGTGSGTQASSTTPITGINPLTGQLVSLSTGQTSTTSLTSSGGTGNLTIGYSAYDPNALLPALPTVVSGGFNSINSITTDQLGNILGFDANNLHLAHGTSTLANSSMVIDANTTITWGRWDGGNIVLTNLANNSITNVPNPAGLHYVAGPAMIALPQTGTYAYSFIGGTAPTDNLGNVGTLNGATLTANFANQTVDTTVSATVNLTTLNATATGMPISGSAISTVNNLIGSSTILNVTCTGTCGTVSGGQMGVTFVGATGQGAGLLYTLTTSSSSLDTTISGSAAFQK
jgi:hypothetical protein